MLSSVGTRWSGGLGGGAAVATEAAGANRAAFCALGRAIGPEGMVPLDLLRRQCCLQWVHAGQVDLVSVDRRSQTGL